MKHAGIALFLMTLGATVPSGPARSQSPTDLCKEVPAALAAICDDARQLLLADPSGAAGIPAIIATRAADGWLYSFGPSGSQTPCADPGPLTLPQHQRIELITTASFELYEFYIPALSLDQTLIPGRLESTFVDASEPGRLDGRMEDISGAPLHNVDASLQILAPQAFDAWLAETMKRQC